jgi:cation diffusion facilitator family transporter
MSKTSIKDLEKYRSRAIYAALTANVCIAVLKWLTFLMSGSTAVYSEALHSSADTFNSIFLLIGVWSSSKPADNEHPYGYGKDAYFWALIASIFMLGVISTSSVTTGYESAVQGKAIGNETLAIIGLLVSILLESIAVYIALTGLIRSVSLQTGKPATYRHLIQAFHKAESPALKLVMLEDSLSLGGALIALVAVLLVKTLGIHSIDGIGALLIGLLLGGMAIILGYENRSKLIGASATDDIERNIYVTAMNYPPVRDIVDMKTMVMGPNKVIAHLKIELDPNISVAKMDKITVKLEKLIIKQVPQVTDCFIEVAADKDDPNQRYE